MSQVVPLKADGEGGGGEVPLAVRFEGVHHSYGHHRALNGLNLTVSRGETVALLGPNGAGKSTTLSLLLGLLHPQTGIVEVLGRSPHDAVASGRVGAMLQTGSGAGLPPGVKVQDALELIRRLYPRPAPFDQIVERANIGPLLGRPSGHLSGGQAQSVRFAMAIAGDPELLFLDEPTSAMDIVARRSFWKGIRDSAGEGRTTVFATHHLQEADQDADRVVVVNHGQVVAAGPGAALKAAVASKLVHFSCERPDPVLLDRLEGVTEMDIRGSSVSLSSLDADATVRSMVAHRVGFRDLEVTSPGLEDVFLMLTETGQPQPDSTSG